MSDTNHESPDQIAELANEARQLIRYSLANKIKPMVAVVVFKDGDTWRGAMLVLYVAETRADPDNKQQMPLAPFFYPYAVGTALTEWGVISEQHVSQKRGIQVHWCSINEDKVL